MRKKEPRVNVEVEKTELEKSLEEFRKVFLNIPWNYEFNVRERLSMEAFIKEVVGFGKHFGMCNEDERY